MIAANGFLHKNSKMIGKFAPTTNIALYDFGWFCLIIGDVVLA